MLCNISLMLFCEKQQWDPSNVDAGLGKVPPMQDESLTKELEDDVEPPIQRPSVSEGASNKAVWFSINGITSSGFLSLIFMYLWLSFS
ncbi:ig-like domain-containing protein [Trichonephila inaurata madagascariensis]|uniref:Ig-like domain-containing protein n=1 Tax=Trichonephila inaurata madagascariensis TaxID=2747483 RepID=A0A8X6YNP5_9ARAC|nr:ig-like domain-containing protein [Trichonephila inaurata madagascariensis]GFY75698.1 ig-like domain-containing protein [Trichonephila inaurata madagascariensis]